MPVVVNGHRQRAIAGVNGQFRHPQSTLPRGLFGLQRSPVLLDKAAELVLVHASSPSTRL